MFYELHSRRAVRHSGGDGWEDVGVFGVLQIAVVGADYRDALVQQLVERFFDESVFHCACHPAAAVEVYDCGRFIFCVFRKPDIDLVLIVRAVGNVFKIRRAYFALLLRGAVEIDIFVCWAASENRGDCAQIVVALANVGQKIRTFRVFVPSVDENRLGVRILRVVLGVLEDFFEEGGIVVFEYRSIGVGRPVDPRELRGRAAALRRVPAHCRNGNVRNRGFLHHFREFFVRGNGVGVFVEKSVALFVEERFVVGVDIVARGVFEARFGEKFCRADGVARVYHCVPADGRESVLLHSLGGLVEHLFDFRRAAVVLYEVERVVHRVERTPVNRVVFGTLEVVFYAVVEHFEEVLLGARERHQIHARGGRLGAQPVCPVVVRPHNSELHFVAVGGFQKALLKRLLHRALAAVPVPVVEEYGNARV